MFSTGEGDATANVELFEGLMRPQGNVPDDRKIALSTFLVSLAA